MSETLTTALERAAQTPKQKAAGELIAANRPDLARLLPPGMDVAALELMVWAAQRDNPKLYDCDPWSLVGAAVALARAGLRNSLGLASLVPVGKEVVPVVGYRGYVDLAHRSGAVKDIAAELVYDGDAFRVVKGTAPKILHEPLGAPEDREVVAAYAVAHLKSGGTVSGVIYEPDWHRAQRSSPVGSQSAGPWRDDLPAMIRKTAIRSLEAWLPAAGFAAAIAIDERPVERIDVTIAEERDSGGQG